MDSIIRRFRLRGECERKTGLAGMALFTMLNPVLSNLGLVDYAGEINNARR